MIALILAGGGCFSAVTPEIDTGSDDNNADAMMEDAEHDTMSLDFATTPEKAFDILVHAALDRDCELFLALMTERVEADESDCNSASLELGAGVPEIDSDATEIGDDTAKLMMTNGRSLTTMVRGEDGLWRADTKFWK